MLLQRSHRTMRVLLKQPVACRAELQDRASRYQRQTWHKEHHSQAMPLFLRAVWLRGGGAWPNANTILPPRLY